MKMDPLAGLATATVPGKKAAPGKKFSKAAPVTKPLAKKGAPKPAPQDLAPIRQARY